MATATKTPAKPKTQLQSKTAPSKQPSLAVIKTGGKQYIVKTGEVLEVELIGAERKQLDFQPLLVISDGKVRVGTPTVEGTKVTAEVVAEAPGQKVRVLKFKPKKRVKKMAGHRQRHSLIKITAIK